MSYTIDRWGVELNGPDDEQKAWRALLKPPFDPFVEEVKDERGNYLALRSTAFYGLATSQEVHHAAKQYAERGDVQDRGRRFPYQRGGGRF